MRRHLHLVFVDQDHCANLFVAFLFLACLSCTIWTRACKPKELASNLFVRQKTARPAKIETEILGRKRVSKQLKLK